MTATLLSQTGKITRPELQIVPAPQATPTHDEFKPCTVWSRSNAFSSSFKELDDVPQFRATVNTAPFMERAV